jgi:hypothetical protein
MKEIIHELGHLWDWPRSEVEFVESNGKIKLNIREKQTDSKKFKIILKNSFFHLGNKEKPLFPSKENEVVKTFNYLWQAKLYRWFYRSFCMEVLPLAEFEWEIIDG